MSKMWKVGSKQDSLSYYAAAPNRETAIKLAEALTGPMNPGQVVCSELLPGLRPSMRFGVPLDRP